MESNGWISFARLFEARNFVMKNIKMSIASSLTAFSFSGQLNRFKNDAKIGRSDSWTYIFVSFNSQNIYCAISM